MNEVLKELRHNNNFTHQEMAQIIGVKTASAYCKKERGYIPFSLQEARSLASYFNMHIEDIFFNKKK